MKLTNYVDGKWQDAGGVSFTPVWNPANGKELAQVQLSTSDDVEKAVQAAKKAQKKMGESTGS